MTGVTDPAAVPHDSFPRQAARTRRFTLGAPRAVTVASDGSRVVFLRSPSGSDPLTSLWVHEVAAGTEHVAVDAGDALAGGEEELTPEERARRERARESAGGITSYACDPRCRFATLALSGRLLLADLLGGSVSELPAAGAVFDPRPDPTCRRVAYTSAGALHVVAFDGSDGVCLAAPEKDGVTWGLAEFVAAEEMDRARGYWWAPDGEALLVSRVDTTPVNRWHIGDPNHPEQPANEVAYPAAGTANADVTVHVLRLDGSRTDVDWDREEFPYLARASWTAGGVVLLVQSRDQRHSRRHLVDPNTGAIAGTVETSDAAWVELVPGSPRRTASGRLVTTVDSEDTRRLEVAGELVTPGGLQVRRVVHADDESVVFVASEEPTETHVWRWSARGLERLTDTPGVHSAVAGGDVVVVSSATLDRPGTTTRMLAADGRETEIPSRAEIPRLRPQVQLLRLGDRDLRAALLLPSGHDGATLPVLLDPYGGPHAQRVVAASDAYLSSQWFADQGFAVLVADGRGTPGRGPAWEREVAGDLASAPLEDQIDALHALAESRPGLLDLDRVAIRGWSFGGYLAALAVLRRPDAVHAAVAGAPVTDWALYDTHYTERYLGVDTSASAYTSSSLLADAPKLSRPLLLVHGLADDNVVAAHTLRLSQALLEAGRAHSVLPLSGVTHMTPQETVAENLLLLQAQWLRSALGLPDR